MDLYRYTARDEKGKNIKGSMQANDENDLHSKLKDENLFLIDAKKGRVKTNYRRITADKISDFARNIGKMIGAGIPLIKALRIVCEDETIKPYEKKIYKNVLRLVKSGMTLSDSMKEQGNAFPPLCISMFKSAEASGNIEQIANQMADYYSKEYKLNKKVKEAMTYPRILCILIVAVVIIIMTYVIPQFKDLFAKMDKLPKTTQMLLAISNFITHRWYLLILYVVIAVLVFKIIFSIPQVKYHMKKLEVHLPIVGPLRRTIYTGRFARSLSSLYSSGIPILACLQISKKTIGNVYIEKQFDKVILDVRTGNNLSEALDKVDGFTKKLAATTLVGEETGTLDTMLVSVADQLDYEAELATTKFVALLEPVMIVIMALIVGFIMISVIQPIYGSYQVIANSSK